MIERLVAILLLLTVSPLLILVALVIFYEDGSPFVFKQYRVGKNGRIFLFYKIRTMKKEMPEVSTSQLINMEKWILRSGYFLRKYSIDEILNLVNIVKGDMSFIGPRPLIVSEKYMHEQRRKLGLNSLKPGITGWAQVNGRDVISDDRKLELEKFYMDNKSIKLDVIILLKTIFYVLWAVRQKLEKPSSK